MKMKRMKKGQAGEKIPDITPALIGEVEETKELLGEEASGKVLVPLILIYEKKLKRSRLNKLMFPLMK